MNSLTRSEALALSPCDNDKVPRLSGKITPAMAFEAGVSLADMLWVAGRLGKADLCAQFARKCAEHVASAAESAAWSAHYAARSAAESAAESARYARYAADEAGAAELEYQKQLFITIFS